VGEESETETIYRNPFTAEIDRRKTHLEALPGYRLKVDLEALNRCSYTFGRNAQELSNHIGRFLRSQTTSAQELSDEHVDELVRLLHHYLTSVTLPEVREEDGLQVLNRLAMQALRDEMDRR
jgi:hypothetical protein